MTIIGKIRIALIDDSALTRHELRRVIDAESDMEVVGMAADGAAGLEVVDQVRPDLLVLDLEMGDVSGLDVLRALRARHPQLPVIVFSALSQRGAAITVEALTEGARDYVAKPSSISPEGAADKVMFHLLTKIRALTRESKKIGGRLAEPPRVQRPRPRAIHRPAVIVIGGSTGAPEALATVLPKLPRSLPVPVVVVVHMPASFTPRIAESLDRRCTLRVRESVDGGLVEAGTIWIAAGGRHLEFSKAVGASSAVLKMHDRPPVNYCRPSVDVLFASAAAVFGSQVLAVQLTGMGKDGLAGAAQIAERGGRILVQDRASSVVWGMPGAVADAGLADEVLHVDKVAARVEAICAGPMREQR